MCIQHENPENMDSWNSCDFYQKGAYEAMY